VHYGTYLATVYHTVGFVNDLILIFIEHAIPMLVVSWWDAIQEEV
jgi:hypothetical protein